MVKTAYYQKHSEHSTSSLRVKLTFEETEGKLTDDVSRASKQSREWKYILRILKNYNGNLEVSTQGKYISRMRAK